MSVVLVRHNVCQQEFCPMWKNACFWCIFGRWIQICFHNFCHPQLSLSDIESSGEGIGQANNKMDCNPTFAGASSSSEPHLLTQGGLNDIVRDLNLSKKQPELLGSRLKGYSVPEQWGVFLPWAPWRLQGFLLSGRWCCVLYWCLFRYGSSWLWI